VDDTADDNKEGEGNANTVVGNGIGDQNEYIERCQKLENQLECDNEEFCQFFDSDLFEEDAEDEADSKMKEMLEKLIQQVNSTCAALTEDQCGRNSLMCEFDEDGEKCLDVFFGVDLGGDMDDLGFNLQFQDQTDCFNLVEQDACLSKKDRFDTQQLCAYTVFLFLLAAFAA